MIIFLYCTWPESSNGYSKIGLQIANFLASKPDVDQIIYFGITRDSAVNRFIHPKIYLIDVYAESPKKDPYGEDLIVDKIIKHKPDIVFMYNDILVLYRMFSKISKMNKTFKTYTYIDLVYRNENSELIQYIDQHTDKFFTFTECWKEYLVTDYKIDPSKIFILYHGLDCARIYKVEKEKARAHFQLDPNDFIFININRNTHRKAIDITLRAFVILLKKNIESMNKLKLFITGNVEPSSYPIFEILFQESVRYGLDYQKVKAQILFNIKSLTDFEINYIYNACDVGINTCFGEGFGLCCLEHASIGKPQIISKVGGLSDIFDSQHSQLIEPVAKIYNPSALDSAGGYWEVCRAEDFAQAMDYYYHHPEKCLADGEYYRKLLPTKYDWNTILNEFYEKHILEK